MNKVILMLIGLGAFFYGSYNAYIISNSLNDTYKLSSLVIEIEKDDNMTRPIFEYLDKSNNKVKFAPSIWSNPPSHKINDIETLRINDNNGDIFVDNWLYIWFIPLVFFSIGIPFLLAAYLSFSKNKTKKHKRKGLLAFIFETEKINPIDNPSIEQVVAGLTLLNGAENKFATLEMPNKSDLDKDLHFIQCYYCKDDKYDLYHRHGDVYKQIIDPIPMLEVKHIFTRFLKKDMLWKNKYSWEDFDC